MIRDLIARFRASLAGWIAPAGMLAIPQATILQRQHHDALVEWVRVSEENDRLRTTVVEQQLRIAQLSCSLDAANDCLAEYEAEEGV